MLERVIIESILEKKGQEIVNINIEEIENTACKNFIICHGESNRQVVSIAEAIEDKVHEKLDEKVYRKHGYQNAQWIILDFFTTVVHVFQKEFRDLYSLEQLWADGKVEKIEG